MRRSALTFGVAATTALSLVAATGLAAATFAQRSGQERLVVFEMFGRES